MADIKMEILDTNFNPIGLITSGSARVTRSDGSQIDIFVDKDDAVHLDTHWTGEHEELILASCCDGGFVVTTRRIGESS